MAPQGGPGHSATQPLSDDVERKTRKDGSPQTERTARPYPAQRLREGKAPRTPCARSADGDAMAEVGKVAGEGRGRENAVRFRSGESKIPMDVSSSVWSTKRSRARQAGANTDATLSGAAVRAHPGDTAEQKGGRCG